MSLGQVRDMIIRVASTVFLPPTTSVKVKESNPLGQYSEHSVADSHNGHTADAAPLTRPGFTRRGFPISSSKTDYTSQHLLTTDLDKMLIRTVIPSSSKHVAGSQVQHHLSCLIRKQSTTRATASPPTTCPCPTKRWETSR